MTVGQYYWLIKALDTGMDWPWQYSFPPFFTIQVSNHVLINFILSHIPDDRSSLLQPHSATRAKQLEAWRHLVLNYCQVIISSLWYLHQLLCRWTQYLSWIWQTPETCLSSTTAPYQEDYLRKQYSQSLKILPNSELDYPCAGNYLVNFPVGTWNGRTRANAEVTYSGNLRRSLAKRYTSEF